MDRFPDLQLRQLIKGHQLSRELRMWTLSTKKPRQPPPQRPQRHLPTTSGMTVVL